MRAVSAYGNVEVSPRTAAGGDEREKERSALCELYQIPPTK